MTAYGEKREYEISKSIHSLSSGLCLDVGDGFAESIRGSKSFGTPHNDTSNLQGWYHGGEFFAHRAAISGLERLLLAKKRFHRKQRTISKNTFWEQVPSAPLASGKPFSQKHEEASPVSALNQKLDHRIRPKIWNRLYSMRNWFSPVPAPESSLVICIWILFAIWLGLLASHGFSEQRLSLPLSLIELFWFVNGTGKGFTVDILRCIVLDYNTRSTL